MSKRLGLSVKKSENFDKWYIEVILKSGLVDYSDVSGCMVLRPDGYFIWEQIQKFTNENFKKAGIKNVYFPLFIPERFLSKEKEHVEGFSPEVAWVTHAGNRKLDERLAVRPTSETIMYPSYAKWIRSWRDLPMRYNQWNNVVRWEFKHAIPLLRTREFLWQEGHTVFATQEEALKEEKEILEIYRKTTEDLLALPGIVGRKTEKEKFAGAVFTTAIEHLLPDGRAVQGPDFHHDGQNFAKAFNIRFLDKNKKRQYAWQNTFGMSTREIGVMVAVHGDDKGLVLPSKVAPIQVVIVPVYNSKTKELVLNEAKKLEENLKEFRTKLDNREEFSPGFKYNEWELKGVPIRIEIGPKDIKEKQVIIVRRDTLKKEAVKINKVNLRIKELLEEIHKNIFNKALEFLKNNTHKIKTYDEFKKVLKEKGGILQACWCGERICEDKVKEETGAKIINIPFGEEKPFSNCIHCGKIAKFIANFAKSY
ncbi:MAG: proline--tRNA ligase [Candidatus Aenigmatarchaeota archaeon]